MTRSRLLLPMVVCAVLGTCASTAWAATPFHPRIKNALGIVPPVGSQGDFTIPQSTLQTPETYHAGNVMTGSSGVTIHTIFWAPSGFAFQGQPAGAPHDYEGMIEQFFTDVAADSHNVGTSASNVFSVLPQFAEGLTPGTITSGNYFIKYDASNPQDLIIDTDPYPAQQCTSPQNTKVCILDSQLQTEVDSIISSHGNSRGLNDLWYVFTPPDVDECISPGVCETNAFGGYHSLSNVGHGVAIYAYTGDPIVETQRVDNPGNDPEGYPDAEHVIDIAAHETVEAMTDPEGVGWMDPNGFEVGDKCEFGPQFGTPLGFAGPDNAPYNQVINGHKYLTQEMWANADTAGNPNCVQTTQTTGNFLPLAQVFLNQFSSTVSGNTEKATAGIPVTVNVIRMSSSGPQTVATGSTTTASDGSWSVSLADPNGGAARAIGDDRDEIDVIYNNGTAGAGVPDVPNQTILTGNGGNPFTESGWTGWFDLDNGYILTNTTTPSSLTMGPCFQTGVLTATMNGAPVVGPNGETTVTDFCSTSADTATIPLAAPVGKGDVVTNSSNDNRAYSPFFEANPNPEGGLVTLTIKDGEADSVSPFFNPMGFPPSGFPTCTADLEFQTATCNGLVPGESYTITDGAQSKSGDADPTGTLSEPLTLHGGDVVALSNGVRTLTTLHVAHLRVDITGEQPTLSGGTCEPGQYFNAPLNSFPTNGFAGGSTANAGGVALTGTICPDPGGSAAGFPSTGIAQTDDMSGGSTTTEVPHVLDTSPMEGEIVYGTFTALAQSGFTNPDTSVTPTDSTSTVALAITKASGGPPVFTSPNVDTVNGVTVSGLAPGAYNATWTLTDANGDTRTVTSRFIEESALQGPPGPPGPRGPQGPPGPRGPKPAFAVCKLIPHHHKVKCTLHYKHHIHGILRMSIARGIHVLALGHGRVTDGSATITLRDRSRVSRGFMTVTLVLAEPHRAPMTIQIRLRVS